MNILLFFCMSNNYNNFDIIQYLFFTHIILTISLFFLNHLIYKRFNTRQLSNGLGIFNSAPKLSFIILCNIFVIIGFPLTIKFFLEIVFFYKIYNFNFFFFILIIISVQFFTGIFFFKNFITALYGNSNKKIFEITKEDYFIYILLFVLLVFYLV